MKGEEIGNTNLGAEINSVKKSYKEIDGPKKLLRKKITYLSKML